MVGKSYGMFAPRKHECGFSAVIWQFEGGKKKKKKKKKKIQVRVDMVKWAGSSWVNRIAGQNESF